MLKTNDDKTWVFVNTTMCKGHFCQNNLTERLIQDLSVRYNIQGDNIISSRTDCYFNISHTIMSTTRTEKISLDMFDILIPSFDIMLFFNKLKNASKRTFSDGYEYYKMHGEFVCVIFTNEQRELVLNSIENILHSTHNYGGSVTHDKRMTISCGDVINNRVKWIITSPRDN